VSRLCKNVQFSFFDKVTLNIAFTDSTAYYNLPKINTIGAQLFNEEGYFIDIKYGIEEVKEEIQSSISAILKASSMM